MDLLNKKQSKRSSQTKVRFGKYHLTENRATIGKLSICPSTAIFANCSRDILHLISQPLPQTSYLMIQRFKIEDAVMQVTKCNMDSLSFFYRKFRDGFTLNV